MQVARTLSFRIVTFGIRDVKQSKSNWREIGDIGVEDIESKWSISMDTIFDSF